MNRTRSAFAGLALLLVGGILVAAAPATAASFVLDQDQESDAGPSCAQVMQSQSVAQTFTAGRSGPLVKAAFDMIQPYGSTATAEIRSTTNAGLPSDTVLASTPIPVPADTFIGWVTVTFSSPATVTAGTTYALVMTDDTDNDLWCNADGTPYAGGAAYNRNEQDSASAWAQPGPATDMAFRTYVGLPAQTITFAGLPALNTTSSDAALSASASSGLPITFSAQTPTVCSVVGGAGNEKVHPISAGTCTIAADQAGDGATYASAPQVTQSVLITKTAQSIDFPDPDTQGFGSSPTLPAIDTSGLPISFQASPGTPACTITPAGKLTFVSVGSCSIEADQSGDGTWDSAPSVTEVFNVIAAPVTVTASDATQVYGASAAPTITATVNGATASALGTITCTSTATPTTPAGVQAGAATCSSADNPNYNVTYIAGDVTVTPAPVVVTAGPSSSVWGTTPTAPTASYAGFVNGQDSNVLTTQATCSPGVSATTPAGTYLNSTTCSGAAAANYTFTYVNGTATVAKAPIVITPATTSAIKAFFSGKITFTAKVTNKVTGAALPGVPVTFLAKSVFGAKVTCTGTSNALGVATCDTKNLNYLLIWPPSGFTASAAAAANYNAATATGRIS